MTDECVKIVIRDNAVVLKVKETESLAVLYREIDDQSHGSGRPDSCFPKLERGFSSSLPYQ